MTESDPKQTIRDNKKPLHGAGINEKFVSPKYGLLIVNPLGLNHHIWSRNHMGGLVLVVAAEERPLV